MDSEADTTVLESLPAEKPQRLGWLGFVALGMLVGVGGDRLIPRLGLPGGALRSEQASAAPQPVLSHVANQIVVPPASPLRTLLGVAPVGVKDVARTLVLPAMVEADPARTVRVLPPATGRVTELKVQLGGRVSEGDVLAVLDSADVAQAWSDVEKARATVTLTKKVLDRQQGLEKAGGAAVRDREQATSDYEQAVSELSRAEVRLRAMGVPDEQKEQSRLLTVRAPVSGSVTDLQAAPGAFLNDPTAAMMTIANLDNVFVTANVPEKDIAFVFPGQTVKVTLRSYPDDVFTGQVLFASDVVEPDSRRNKVRIAFANPDRRFKPNMFADAVFEAPATARLMVPTAALLMTNDVTSVFVEAEAWTFERRNIKIAYQEGAAVAVASGLSKDDRVVVKGAVRLND